MGFFIGFTLPWRAVWGSNQIVQSGQIALKTYYGANLHAPYAVVVAEFEDLFGTSLPLRDVQSVLGELYPVVPPLVVEHAEEIIDFVHFVAALADSLQGRIWQNALPPAIARLEEKRCSIALGYYDPVVARDALAAGIQMTNAAFLRASGDASATRIQSPSIRRLLTRSYERPLSQTTATLTRLARGRGIPVHPVSERAGIHMFGQGAKGIHFRALANQFDSLTGQRLSQRKDITSELLRRLGFPAVEHQIAANAASAHEISASLGFPLAVKPIDQDFGTGVIVGIDNAEELGRAFEHARAASPSGQVLVERYVEGEHHRITTFNGKLAAVSLLLPPMICGDGASSVAELIEAENVKRSENPNLGRFLPKLTVDADMRALLLKQGSSLNDQPQTGAVLRLRTTSNLHTGGTREDVTQLIHPENILMAEAIARCFHLDAMGIDFMTPDIAKAWYETSCAILEVNCNAGVGTESVLEKILLEKFPSGDNARIPSVLIVEEGSEIIDRVTDHAATSGKRVGRSSAHLTALAGERRAFNSSGGAARGDFPARILSLLLDPNCEAMVVSCTAKDIADYGIPHTRFDLAVICAECDLIDDLNRLIEENASQLIENITLEDLSPQVFPLISSLLGMPQEEDRADLPLYFDPSDRI